MNITWKQNPLATIVELDDRDLLLLRARVKLEIAENLFGDVFFALYDSPKELRADALEQVKKVLDEWYEVPDHVEEARVSQQVDGYAQALQDSHCGDCTCVAMACMKCWAEGYLGIDTMKESSKHIGHSVMSFFRAHPEATAFEAWQALREPSPAARTSPTWDHLGDEEWERLVRSWARDREQAAVFMMKYHAAHFAEMR
jgi:hypothetical protein